MNDLIGSTTSEDEARDGLSRFTLNPLATINDPTTASTELCVCVPATKERERKLTTSPDFPLIHLFVARDQTDTSQPKKMDGDDGEHGNGVTSEVPQVTRQGT